MLTEGIFPANASSSLSARAWCAARDADRPARDTRQIRPFAPPLSSRPPPTHHLHHPLDLQSTGIVAGAVLVKVPQITASSPTAPSPASARRCFVRGAQRHVAVVPLPTAPRARRLRRTFLPPSPEPHPVPHRLLRRTSRGRHRVARRRRERPGDRRLRRRRGLARLRVVSGSHLEAAYIPPPCSSRAARRKFWPIIARVRRELSFATQALMSTWSSGAYRRRGGGAPRPPWGAYLASAAMNWIILAQMVAYKGAAGKDERKRRSEGGGSEGE